MCHHTQEKIKKKNFSQALVVHTCNPTYSGGTDKEDQSSKPILKIPNTETGLVE
jgi:hypothetical protein